MLWQGIPGRFHNYTTHHSDMVVRLPEDRRINRRSTSFQTTRGLREALALPFTKTIYVNGTIEGSQLDNGTYPRSSSYFYPLTSTGRYSRNMRLLYRRHERRIQSIRLYSIPSQPQRDLRLARRGRYIPEHHLRRKERHGIPGPSWAPKRLAARGIQHPESPSRILAHE